MIFFIFANLVWIFYYRGLCLLTLLFMTACSSLPKGELSAWYMRCFHRKWIHSPADLLRAAIVFIVRSPFWLLGSLCLLFIKKKTFLGFNKNFKSENTSRKLHKQNLQTQKFPFLYIKCMLWTVCLETVAMAAQRFSWNCLQLFHC